VKIVGPFGSFATTGSQLERDSTRRSSRVGSSSASNAEAARAKPGGTLNLSAEALLPSSGRDWFDGAKVDRLRVEYEGGRLQANPRAIAERMLEDG
jgi:hypothetical protein